MERSARGSAGLSDQVMGQRMRSRFDGVAVFAMEK
jgi:hypothetical protein